MNAVKKYLKWIVLIVAIVLFIWILQDVLRNKITSYDASIYNFISDNFIKESNHFIAKTLTFFGSTLGIIIFAIIALVVVRNKKDKALVAINLIATVASNQITKFLVARPRPSVLRIVEETGFSFPSGHSMASFAFYGLIIYLVWKNTNNKALKWLVTIFLSLLVLFIGLSRIYLGVHYASDVFAGFIGGLIVLIIVISLWQKYGEKSEK